MKPVSEKQSKRQLQRMLGAFTAGSILHLLADLHRDAAREARRAGDAKAYRQCKTVEHALFVTGMGIDAASPR